MILLYLICIAYGSWCGPPLPCEYLKAVKTTLNKYKYPINVVVNQTVFYGMDTHGFRFDSYLGMAACHQMLNPIKLIIPFPDEWNWGSNRSVFVAFNFQDELSLIQWCVTETEYGLSFNIAPFGIPFEFRVGFNSTIN